MLQLLVVCCLLPWYTSAQCVLGDLKYSVAWLDAAGTRYSMYQDTDSGPPLVTYLQATYEDPAHNGTVDGHCDSTFCEAGQMCFASDSDTGNCTRPTPFAVDATCNIMTFTPGGGGGAFQWTRYVPASGTPTPSFSPTVSFTPSASPMHLPAAAASTSIRIYIGEGAGAAALLCAGGGGLAVFFCMRRRRQAEAEPHYKKLAVSIQG